MFNLTARVKFIIFQQLRQFFAAVQDVADDPASIPARQVMLSQGEALSARFLLVSVTGPCGTATLRRDSFGASC
jgi:hypothetical protein